MKGIATRHQEIARCALHVVYYTMQGIPTGLGGSYIPVHCLGTLSSVTSEWERQGSVHFPVTPILTQWRGVCVCAGGCMRKLSAVPVYIHM